MDTRNALTVLDLPRGEGYYDSPIPSSEDSRIARAVRAFSEAEPAWQAAFREAIDTDRADLLCVWSERVAALAVRLDSQRLAVSGLVGQAEPHEAEHERARAIEPDREIGRAHV